MSVTYTVVISEGKELAGYASLEEAIAAWEEHCVEGSYITREDDEHTDEY